MPKTELLPGVSTSSCPPRVVCDARDAIRRARKRTIVRDAAQFALLVAVDWFFLTWPEARAPFLTRAESATLLQGMNAAMLAHFCAVRALPRWSARRIAETWSRSERARFER